MTAWTEEQLRAALNEHHPTSIGAVYKTVKCSCSAQAAPPEEIRVGTVRTSRFAPNPPLTVWTVDHFMDCLRGVK